MSECEFCNEELNGLPIICPKCGKAFCSKHKFPKDHDCANLEKEEVKETQGPVDKDHDRRVKEKETYIEEEVQIIKRRVKNESLSMKFFKFIIDHHMMILIVALLVTGFYVQKNDIYDIKGKAIEVLTSLKAMAVSEAQKSIDTPEIINYNKTDIGLESQNDQVLEDSRTLVAKILETPSLYVNTDVEVEGYVEWKEITSANLKFQYVVYDENRKYIPFLFNTQNVGFNKYSKYKIYGMVKKDGERVYIDSYDTEKMI